MKKTYLLLIAAVILLGGYTIFRVQQGQPAPVSQPVPEDKVIMKDADEIKTDDKDDAMMKDDDVAEDETMMKDKEISGSTSFRGTVLAGSAAPLLDFDQEDYEAALAANKNIVLYFYATWCPICVAEFPKMQLAFNQLDDNSVVGFRVNYNDNQTDAYETGLAREFGVAYQHTKVFIKNGQRILKAPDSWDTDRYVSEIAEKLL
ncbi:MAG: thioredoxin family protein [Patescibacteria group bacterium]